VGTGETISIYHVTKGIEELTLEGFEEKRVTGLRQWDGRKILLACGYKRQNAPSATNITEAEERG